MMTDGCSLCLALHIWALSGVSVVDAWVLGLDCYDGKEPVLEGFVPMKKRDGCRTYTASGILGLCPCTMSKDCEGIRQI